MLSFRFVTMLDDYLVSGEFSEIAEIFHSRHVGDSGQKIHTKIMGMGQICEVSRAIGIEAGSVPIEPRKGSSIPKHQVEAGHPQVLRMR